MDPATEELLFMGMECETSGIEAYNTVRDMENLDTEAAVERTRAILAWLASRNMIDLFLGNRSRMSLTPATVTRLAPTSSEQTGSGPWTVPMTGGRASASHPLDKGLGPRSGFPDRGPKPREVLLLPGFP